MKSFTAIEMAELIDPENLEKVNVWLARNDGIAVYRNEDLGSADVGERQFMSFGSSAAMFLSPPERLPDFSGKINWRYMLEGTYRGKPLEPAAAHDFVEPTKVLDLILSSFRAASWDAKKRARLVDYSIKVQKFAHGPSRVVIDLDVTSSIEVPPTKVNDALRGDVEIRVTTWTNDDGLIDRLAPFSWEIDADWLAPVQPGDTGMTGGDPNLGSTIVAIHNNSMRPSPRHRPPVTQPPRKGVMAWGIQPMEENGDEFFVLTFHHGLGHMTRLDLDTKDVRDLARSLTAAIDNDKTGGRA